ncbi:MAG: hypothetical protein JWO48_3062 [Bryobacterales bacterium]|nr:hypothetical protein [Bryobacterales bacterium]
MVISLLYVAKYLMSNDVDGSCANPNGERGAPDFLAFEPNLLKYMYDASNEFRVTA